MMGYRMILVMPANSSVERVQTMKAYGAEVVLTPAEYSVPGAIDEARRLRDAGVGCILDQFSNPDNPLAHIETTGPEIWRDAAGSVTHFCFEYGNDGYHYGDLYIFEVTKS